MITKNHTPNSHKSIDSKVYNFLSVKYHLCDTPVSFCDPPKDPELQCFLQGFGPNQRLGPRTRLRF